MSKNNNPQTRPGSVRRRRPKPQAPPPAPTVEIKQSKVRRFLPAVVIPNGVAALLVVVVALAVLMFSDTGMVALPATIAQLWLALNMSPVSGSGEVIGVIPMLPAMLLTWAVARRVYGAVKKRVSIADLAVLAALIIAVPLSLIGIASAMLYDASNVLDVEVPPIPMMLGRVLLLHVIALAIGMGPRLWRALARRYGVPEWLVDSVGLAIRFLVIYGVAALVVVAVMLAVNHQVFADALAGYQEGSAVPALILLSLLYLPNVVVSAMGVLVGAPLYFGDGSISLFSVTMVPLPPLPILAALPASAPPWGVVLLIIPAIVAAWVCIKNPMRLVVTITAAAFSAIFFLALCLLAGGPLGVYGYVGLNLLSALGLLFGYLFLVGLLISGIDRLRNSARAPADEDHGEESIRQQSASADAGNEEVPDETAVFEAQGEDSDGEEQAVYIEPENDEGSGEETAEEAPPEPAGVLDETGETGVKTAVDETDDGSKADDR